MLVFTDKKKEVSNKVMGFDECYSRRNSRELSNESLGRKGFEGHSYESLGRESSDES